MVIYALCMIPLAKHVREAIPNLVQLWYINNCASLVAPLTLPMPLLSLKNSGPSVASIQSRPRALRLGHALLAPHCPFLSRVETLVKYAGKYPQTAYVGLSKSFQQEWQYVQRVTPGIGAFFQPVEKAIKEKFRPALFGLPVSAIQDLRPLFTLLVREGGLEIPNPTESANRSFISSYNIVVELTDAFSTNNTPLDMAEFLQDVRKYRQN